MRTALMMVDVQRNMLEGALAVPSAAAVPGALQELLAMTRASGAMVVHVQDDGGPGDPDEPGTDGWHLVFPPAGMRSDNCVDATARAALRRGFAVHLVAGAHPTYDAGEPASAVSARVEAGLREAGVRVVALEEARDFR